MRGGDHAALPGRPGRRRRRAGPRPGPLSSPHPPARHRRPVLVAEVVRGHHVEGGHHGSVAVVDAGGRLLGGVGDVDGVVLPRSALKPAQAAALLEAGLADVLPRAEEPERLLALVAASNSGEPHHVATARELLALVGLDDTALRNTPRLPLGEAAREAHLRAGGGPASVLADCSGKHAGMLATCVAAGWPTEDYLDPAHPVQRAVARGVSELAGLGPDGLDEPEVDGCGAPLLPLPLPALARTAAALATSRVADAMRAHPETVGGTGRDVSALLAHGLLAKDGAEGVYVAAVPDGPAVALKIWDGAERARLPVLLAVLEELEAIGVDPSRGDLDDMVAPGAAEAAISSRSPHWGAPRRGGVLDDPPLLGGGRVVGRVRAADGLRASLRSSLQASQGA